MMAPRFIAICLVRLYQLVLSPIKGVLFGSASCCRYLPSCSCYAIESFRVHGLLRGTVLTARRLLRCHPWGGSGFDPVPAPKTDANATHACRA
jgi:putative membrane protein insertion efficiency factor